MAVVAEVSNESKDPELVDVELGKDGVAVVHGGLTELEGTGNSYTLQCRDVSYSIDIKENKESKKKVLIQPISFTIRPKEMLAIMGASGAGKSTLLDILAGRISPNALSGEYLLNGKPVGPSFQRVSGYVMQDDQLYPLLTVRETLQYAALLRIPNMTKAQKWKVVEETLAALKLTKCADTVVGDSRVRGVSGGEKRRVSIGCDIVHQPSIIFLDEPTSGLDSTTALQICQTLREICSHNRTVSMTIHQPSMRVFETFSKVMFLSRGYLVYLDSPDNLPGYLSKLTNKPLPAYVNLPEFFLEVVDTYEANDTVHELSQTQLEASRARQPSASNMGAKAEEPSSAYCNNVTKETWYLLHRNLRNVVRTPELFVARLGLSVMMGLVLGSLFWNTKNTDKGTRKRTAYVAFLEALFLFTSMEALPIFLNERAVYLREHSRGAYRAASYAYANFLVYLPFFVTMAMLFTSISYFMVGMPSDAGHFFFQVLVTFLVLYMGNSFATFVSSVVPDALTGNSVGTAFFAFAFLFSGFFIPRNQIPMGWRWFHYLSMFKYPYDSLVTNMLDGIKNATVAEIDGWKKDYGVTGTDRWTGVWAIILFILGWRALFYLALRFKHKGGRT